MSTHELRNLSVDEIDAGSGGTNVPGYVHCSWPTDALWGPNKICDVPADQAEYYDVNVHFFDEIGSPGGAAKMGRVDADHPVVLALPPQGE